MLSVESKRVVVDLNTSSSKGACLNKNTSDAVTFAVTFCIEIEKISILKTGSS